MRRKIFPGSAVFAAAASAVLVPTPAAAAELAASGGWLGWGLFVASVLSLGGLAAWLAVRGRAANEAAALFGDALETIPDPRQIVDADDKVVYANTAFRDFFGDTVRPMAELLAEQAVGDEEAVAQVKRLAANARNGVGGHAEIRVRASRPAGRGGSLSAAVTPAGEVEWRSVAAYPIRCRSGSVLWLVSDITSRREMEQILQEEQARFVDLLEHAPIGFYSVDGEGHFLFVNRKLADWLGRSPEELLQGDARLHDIVADTLPKDTPAYQPLAANGDVQRGEIELRSKDGSTFRAFIGQDVVRDEDGRIVRTRSVVRHLTRERAMAAALQESEQRFRRFFEEAPVGIALTDTAGMVTVCNSAFRAVAGVTTENGRGLSLVDILDDRDRPALRDVLAALGKGNGSLDEPAALEVRVKAKVDTVCSMFVTRMEDASGVATGLIVHFIEITEQKNLEVQIAQSQKMQAIGQLAGGIAHDFNNLLTAMIGFSDLLLIRHRPGDQSFADIMQIKQNANRAANLVRQLLAFSRQQTLQPRVLDVTDILAELSHLLRRLIGENIELRMNHGRDLGPVKADQGQLEQVIINLAVNARDAMPEGGTLNIRTANVVLDRQLKRGAELMPPGSYVLIEVADTGCGIPRDNLARIFEPFFSTKELGAGTGLGLATVYGIVKQTGGFLFVDSMLDVGTNFHIYLPRHTHKVAEEDPREGEQQPSLDLTGVGTVLLVEDEDAVRAFSARALRNKGYNVLEARSGEVALQLLSTCKDPIDLLITDVVMPRIDGPTLVREVRETQPKMKVIFISGYAEDAFRKHLDEDAAIHFLPKPFSLKQLAGKVKEVLLEPAHDRPSP